MHGYTIDSPYVMSQVSPRPLITSVPLRVSLAPAEAAPADAEEAAIRMELQAAHIKAFEPLSLQEGQWEYVG